MYIFRPLLIGMIILSANIGSIFANTLSVDSIIRNVLSSHPNILAAKAQKEALLKNVLQSQLGLNPDFEISLGQKTDGISNGSTIETGLRQTFLFPGKSEAKKSLSQGEVSLQDIEIERLRASLANALLVKLYERDYVGKRRIANQTRISRLNFVKDYLSSRPFVSPQKRLELKLVESKLREHQMDEIQLKAQLEELSSQLEIFGEIPEFVELAQVPFDTDVLTSSRPKAQSLEAKSILSHIQQLERESNLLDLEAKPDFDVLGKFASGAASGTDQSMSLGIGLELPFTNKTSYSQQALIYKKKGLEYQLNQLKKEQDVQWIEVLITLKKSQDILSLYSNSWLKQLETSLLQTLNDFKRGQVDLLSVLELDTQWGEALMKQYEAKLDWIKSY
ncbi:MAG: TolC family protein, partial [Candidatus Margulisiibacteriota bacterium]